MTNIIIITIISQTTTKLTNKWLVFCELSIASLGTHLKPRAFTI